MTTTRWLVSFRMPGWWRLLMWRVIHLCFRINWSCLSKSSLWSILFKAYSKRLFKCSWLNWKAISLRTAHFFTNRKIKSRCCKDFWMVFQITLRKSYRKVQMQFQVTNKSFVKIRIWTHGKMVNLVGWIKHKFDLRLEQLEIKTLIILRHHSSRIRLSLLTNWTRVCLYSVNLRNKMSKQTRFHRCHRINRIFNKF